MMGSRAAPGWAVDSIDRSWLGTRLFWQALALFAVAFVIRAAFAAHLPPRVDELYHLLAARSWAEDGSLRIWHGEYTRTRYFTMLIGLLFEATGRETLFVARLPSVLFGSTLVALLFLWVRREADAAAAWFAAILLALSSLSITIDQYARFYALHALLFWTASILVYEVVSGRAGGRVVPMVGAAIALLLGAFYLQLTTLLGIAALGLWVTATLALRPRVRRHLADRRVLILLGIGGALAALLIATLLREPLAQAYDRFRWAPLWSAERKDDLIYYVRLLTQWMPLLWHLLPVAAVLAIVRAPRAAGFCLTLALAILAIHSFGAMKKTDYVAYTMLYLFTVYGLAFTAVLPKLVGIARLALGRLGVGERALDQPPLRAALGMFVAGAVGFALIGNDMIRLPLFALGGGAKAAIAGEVSSDAAWAKVVPTDNVKWDRHTARLRELAGENAVLVTTDELKALYYLGRYDILLHRSRLSEYAPDRDFARDARTGGPTIGSALAVAAVIDCWPSGLLITDRHGLNKPEYMTAEAGRLIERRLTPVPLPNNRSLLVMQWRHAAWTPGAACADVRRAVKPSTARLPSGTIHRTRG